ncbi:Rha family transcriptional regulator [Pseudomonas sp. LB1P83]
MNAVIMTTLEIAELTGKRHDHVLRDVRRALESINEALKSEDVNAPKSGAVESTFVDKKGETRPMMVLDKHLTFTVITGYDTALRHVVVGRWIELEAQANPGFLAQSITESLNDLQKRVDMMAPVFTEHTRKGSTVGYTWREACRLAGVENPDKVLAMLVSKGLARVSKGLTELHVKYVSRGHARTVNKNNKAISLTGHLFRITLKGVEEWLQPNAEDIAQALAEHLKVRAVVDAEGYVLDIVGEGSKGLKVQDLPKVAQ